MNRDWDIDMLAGTLIYIAYLCPNLVTLFLCNPNIKLISYLMFYCKNFQSHSHKTKYWYRPQARRLGGFGRTACTQTRVCWSARWVGVDVCSRTAMGPRAVRAREETNLPEPETIPAAKKRSYRGQLWSCSWFGCVGGWHFPGFNFRRKSLSVSESDCAAIVDL